MATAKNIIEILYSEASMTSDNFNNKYLVLWSGAMPEGSKKKILVDDIFVFEGLTSLKKLANTMTPLSW